MIFFKKIPFFGLLVFLGIEITTIPLKSQPQDISVMTYNLFHIYSSKYNPIVSFPIATTSMKERVRRQIDEIKNLEPTFILLQEAFHKESRDFITKELNSIYGTINSIASNNSSSWYSFGSGLLILFRKDRVTYNNNSAQFHPFPYDKSLIEEYIFGTKGFITANFKDLLGKNIRITNTHLASSDYDKKIHNQQIEFILEKLSSVTIKNELDIDLIGGDFNLHYYDKNNQENKDFALLTKKNKRNYVSAIPKSKSNNKFLPSWNPKNSLVELSKWPLGKPEILDYLFVRTKLNSCKLTKVDQVMNKTYSLPSLNNFVKKRIDERKKSIKTLKSTNKKMLKKLEEFRIKIGYEIWNWKEEAENYDPNYSIRGAIDNLLKLSEYRIQDIESLMSSSKSIFKFNRKKLPKLHLSDHFGIKASINCNIQEKPSLFPISWNLNHLMNRYFFKLGGFG